METSITLQGCIRHDTRCISLYYINIDGYHDAYSPDLSQ